MTEHVTEHALKRGGHLVVLVDVELYDAAGALTATHRLGLGHYVPSRADSPTPVQYLDRMTAGQGALGANTELGRGGVEVAGELRFANRAGDLTGAGAAMLAAAAVEARLRLGAQRRSGVALGDFAAVGHYRVGSVEVGEEIVLELVDGARDLREHAIELSRYRGYGYAVDMRASFPDPPQDFLVAASPELEPVSGLSAGLALFLFSAPGSDAYLVTLLSTPSGPAAAALRLTPSRTLKSIVRDSGGVDHVVEHQDLVVPLETWTYVEMRWEASTGRIEAMLDGAVSADTATSATIAGVTGGLRVGDPFASATPAALVTEVRYATSPATLEVLAARALWALPPEVWAEYTCYLRTGPVPGTATDRLWDSGPHDLTVTAGSDVVLVDTATGSSSVAGEVMPRVIGLKTEVTAARLDEDGRRHGFAEGPLQGLTHVYAGDRELWLRASIVVVGTWGPQSFEADPGQPSLRTLQVGQYVTGTVAGNPNAQHKRIAAVTDRTLILRPLIQSPPGYPLGWDTWTIATADPYPETVDVEFHAPNELRSADGKFRWRRAGQEVGVSGSASNDGTKTLLADALPPYRSVYVAETVSDETASDVALTWAEPYDAVVDLDLGHVVMELGADEVVADVYGSGEATIAGLIRELATVDGLRAWPVDFGASIQGLADAAAVGLLIDGETTIGAELDRVAATVDATWYQHPVSGLLELLELAAPAAAEDLAAREIVSSRTLRTWPAIAGLTVRYQRGTVDVGGAARRGDLPVVETLDATAEGARAHGKAMLARRAVERRGVEIEVPIWALSWALLGATLRTAGDPDAAASLWRVLAVGWELPATVTITLWR